MEYFIGVDPGSKSGAWAVINEEGAVVDCGLIADRYRLVAFLIENLFASKAREIGKSKVRACIEEAHSRPGQSCKAGDSLIVDYGTWMGTFDALYVPYITVPPQRWQGAVLDKRPVKKPKVKEDDKKANDRRLQENRTALKAAIVDFVCRQYPDLREKLSKRDQQGVADAICIALYLRKGSF